MKKAITIMTLAALAMFATGCAGLNKQANDNVAYATKSDLQTMYGAISEKVALVSATRDDALAPETLATSPNNPGAVMLRKSKRAQIHNGAVIAGDNGAAIMEEELVIVKSSTYSSVDGANEALAGLVVAATDANGNAILRPNGQPAYNYVSARAKASGDTVTFGRVDSLRKAHGDARTNQLAAAVDHVKAHYEGSIRLREVQGETLVSVIREGRETAIGVLERVTPIGAATLGAERAVKLLVKDDAGSREVTVDKE